MDNNELNIEVVDKEKDMMEQFSAIGDLIISTTSKGNSASYSKDDIENMLSNVYKNDAKLRQVSDWFYYNNGIYKNIINAFANLPTLDYHILPSQKTLQKNSDKAYTVYLDKVRAYTDSINIKLFSRRVLKSVAKYGGYVGYERTNGSDVYIQDLPLDYCRVKYKLGSEYQIEFNFKYFDKFYQAEDLELAWEVYPKEFESLYRQYKSDRKSRQPEWQPIDIKKTFCILAEDDEPYFIPMFTGMFQSLLSNEEYKDIIKTGEKLSISKLIVQKVPTDPKDGTVLMPKDMIKMFHDNLKKIIPDGANGLTTPLDITDVTFKNSNQEKEELLNKAEKSVFVNSGFSGAIFSDNGGISGVNANIEYVTSNVFAILEKIEDILSKKLRSVASSKNYEFKVKFYRTTNINIKESFDRQYKLVEIGGAINPLISLSGINPDDYFTLLQMENEMGIKDLLITPQSIHTQSGSSEAGRPSIPDNEVDNESTAVSKNRGSNLEGNR